MASINAEANELIVDREASWALDLIGGDLRVKTIRLAGEITRQNGESRISKKTMLDAFRQVFRETFPTPGEAK